MWPHQVFASTARRQYNKLSYYRWKRDMKILFQNIYLQSRTSVQSTSKTIIIWMFYFVGLLAYKPKSGLPLYLTSLCVLILWSCRVLLFERKLERKVEILRIIKKLVLVYWHNFQLMWKETYVLVKIISSNKNFWRHAKANVKAAD